MRTITTICLLFALWTSNVNAGEFDPEAFARTYFQAWTATQSPTATEADIEAYLSLLADNVGHQHLPYDPDDSRAPDGKQKMREGMNYYRGAHTEYTGTLTGTSFGYNVIVIQYDTFSKGVHPQTGQEVESRRSTLEVLEIEDGKVSVIRKYSE